MIRGCAYNCFKLRWNTISNKIKTPTPSQVVIFQTDYPPHSIEINNPADNANPVDRPPKPPQEPGNPGLYYINP